MLSHLSCFYSPSRCVEGKLVYTVSIIYIEWLASPVVIADDSIVMKIISKGMLGAVTQVNHPLPAISVRDHTAELIICKSICATALLEPVKVCG